MLLFKRPRRDVLIAPLVSGALASRALTSRALVPGSLALSALALTPQRSWARSDRFATITPRPLQFPRDHGAHPQTRTEWWYLTGWLTRPEGPDFGFQITFFRSATGYPEDNPSRFAPRQLLIGHAALALPERGRLLHVERVARALPPLALADDTDTDIRIGTGSRRWALRRDPHHDTYEAEIQSPELALQLRLEAPTAPLLQGQAGYSRKGPLPTQASHYYSRPQLSVQGRVRISPGAGPDLGVQGRAWFDHEWSSDILGDDAVGWDWVGINLDDGGALMAFRIRDAQGRTLWQDASLRQGPQGPTRTGLSAGFEPLRWWSSTRTAARWPVAQRLRIEGRVLDLHPLFDDQELVMRGVTYWEGAVRISERGQAIGRGYLELTGYAGRVRL
jgi:predicted secreted hydrolase